MEIHEILVSSLNSLAMTVESVVMMVASMAARNEPTIMDPSRICTLAEDKAWCSCSELVVSPFGTRSAVVSVVSDIAFVSFRSSTEPTFIPLERQWSR